MYVGFLLMQSAEFTSSSEQEELLIFEPTVDDLARGEIEQPVISCVYSVQFADFSSIRVGESSAYNLT